MVIPGIDSPTAGQLPSMEGTLCALIVCQLNIVGAGLQVPVSWIVGDSFGNPFGSQRCIWSHAGRPPGTTCLVSQHYCCALTSQSNVDQS